MFRRRRNDGISTLRTATRSFTRINNWQQQPPPPPLPLPLSLPPSPPPQQPEHQQSQPLHLRLPQQDEDEIDDGPIRPSPIPLPAWTPEVEEPIYGADIPSGHSRWCKCPGVDEREQLVAQRRLREANADEQALSPLFARLPVEIRRLILREVWAMGGYSHGVHIYFDVFQRRFYQTPCITDPEEGEKEEEESKGGMATNQQDGEEEADPLAGIDGTPPPPSSAHQPHVAAPVSPNIDWSNNFASVWFNHWKCDELADRRTTGRAGPTTQGLADALGDSALWQHPRWSPFLPVLLSCKRLYAEATESIFENLTFTFHNRWVPLRFFAHRPHPMVHRLRSVHFTINFWNGGFSEWECLWATLAELEGLREIRVWLNQEPVVSGFNNGDVTVEDVMGVVGERLAHKVVFSIPIVESSNPYQRKYDLEGAPFGVRWHRREPMSRRS